MTNASRAAFNIHRSTSNHTRNLGDRDQNSNLELQPSNQYGILISQKIQCLIYHGNRIDCPRQSGGLDDHLPFRPILRAV